MRFAGELAALGTAACWATGSNFFAAAGRRMGSMVLNRLRLPIALVLLVVTLAIARGAPWPTWATPLEIGVLAASGLVGFVFGDSFAFRSLVILGPGRGALLVATAPLFTTLFAWPLLHERPGPLALLGMLLVVSGVGLVRYDGTTGAPPSAEGGMVFGVVCGLLGAIGQAGGYVLSKIALSSGLDALSATVIRTAAATLAIWILAIVTGEARRTWAALGDRRGLAFTAGGAVAGPYLGVTLSLVALAHAPAGVAASIIAVYPVLTMVIAARFHKEPLAPRSLAGALVAVAGVVVLFYR